MTAHLGRDGRADSFDDPAQWRAEVIRELRIRGVERCAVACPAPGFPQLLESILAAIAESPPGVWIDVGGGLGGVSDWLMRKTRRRVVMVEPASGNIAAARTLFPLLTATQSSPDRLPVADEVVSAEVVSGVVSKVDDLGPVVGELHRVLKPGGIVAIADLWSATDTTWRDGANTFWSVEDVVETATSPGRSSGMHVADVAMCDVGTGWWTAAAEQVDSVIWTSYGDRSGFDAWAAERRHVAEILRSGRVLAGAVSFRRS